MLLLRQKPLSEAAILEENKFLRRSHFDIFSGVFSLAIWEVWGGNHLISVQDKFSLHCNSSLSDHILPSTAACDLEETKRETPYLF